MFRERETSPHEDIHPEPIVVGNGRIGEKARELKDKARILRRVGFHAPRRTVLPGEHFAEFYQRNLNAVQDLEDLEGRISRGSLTQREISLLTGVSQSYGSNPLAIRSSAEGDARGTGTYRSEFAENRLERVVEASKRVLASYFSEDAIAFRRDARTGEGFAVIFEPIVGQRIGKYYTPVLSGFAYTSTSRGEGYINAVPGLGGGVESRDGQRITRSDLEPYGGILGDYIVTKPAEMAFEGLPSPRSALFRNNTEQAYTDLYEAQVYVPGFGIETQRLDLDRVLGAPFYNLNLTQLFEKMERLESELGQPQYFEWAMTLKGQEPVFWLLQIADVSKQLDMMDFGDLGEPLFEGHTVTGTGLVDCSAAVYCARPNQVPVLREFNRKSRDYLAIYSSELTSHGGKLSYRTIDQAAVLIEDQKVLHAGNPLGHLEGQLDMTGKLFGVLDFQATDRAKWEAFKNEGHEENGLWVREGKLTVAASARQNRIVVSRPK